MVYPGSTMIGTGLTPEGILQNEVVYALSTDVSWQQRKVNVTQWYVLTSKIKDILKNGILL